MSTGIGEGFRRGSTCDRKWGYVWRRSSGFPRDVFFWGHQKCLPGVYSSVGVQTCETHSAR